MATIRTGHVYVLVMRFRRCRSAAVLPLTVLLTLAFVPGCSGTGSALAGRAFVEAANLQCRSTRARVEIAGRLARATAQTEEGKQLTAEVRAELDAAKRKAAGLVERFAGLAGSAGLHDELTRGFEKLQEIPGRVADGELSREEGLRQVDQTRASLRKKGFVDCV